MKSLKSTKKRPLSRVALSSNQGDVAAKIANAVTSAVNLGAKKTRGSALDEKFTINIHVGDVFLIGFDEAIDAEEWGMRENNTEVVGGNRAKANSRSVDDDALANKNKKIARSINFSKGDVKIIAGENSSPVIKKKTSKVATKKAATVKKPGLTKKATGRK